MEEGYGFGAEGDWKTACLYRTLWVIQQGMPTGCSFLEDYTLNFAGDRSSCLQSHMLEVCPLIAVDKPKLEVHFLGIGIRKQQTARALWVPQPTFEIGAGAWILAGGTHHSAFSYDITEEYWEDFAEMTGIEYVRINKDTKTSEFKQQLQNNEMYYMLSKALR